MTKYQIQSGPTPLPKRNYKNPSPTKYPWDALAIGDWFAFDPMLKAKSAYNIAKYAGLRSGKKFAVHSTEIGFIARRIA